MKRAEVRRLATEDARGALLRLGGDVRAALDAAIEGLRYCVAYAPAEVERAADAVRILARAEARYAVAATCAETAAEMPVDAYDRETGRRMRSEATRAAVDALVAGHGSAVAQHEALCVYKGGLYPNLREYVEALIGETADADAEGAS